MYLVTSNIRSLSLTFDLGELILLTGNVSHHPLAERRAAYRAARQGSVSYDDLMNLVCSLPSSDLPPGPIFNIHDQQPRALLTGACVHGGTAATLSNLSIYPWTTRLFCSVARQQAPAFWFMSIAVNLNCQSSVHRDSNNHSVLPSAMIPASIFIGGQLWVENAGGSILVDGVPGDAIDVRLPFITFQSRRRHANLSWTGNHLVILLYHIREAWRLSEVSRDRLAGAGFHIHTSDALTDPYL